MKLRAAIGAIAEQADEAAEDAASGEQERIAALEAEIAELPEEVARRVGRKPSKSRLTYGVGDPRARARR